MKGSPIQDSLPPSFDSVSRDNHYWSALGELFRASAYSERDILRNFQAYIMRRDIPRFLSHYELFKQVVDLPGCILDLGVYRGASFFTWVKLLDIFCPFDRSRKVYGFDQFQGLVDFTASDGKEDAGSGKQPGGYRASEENIRTLVDLHNADTLMPGTTRCELVLGPIQETLPGFIQDHPGLRISLLHFDLDLFEPTKVALHHLFPLVVKGGIFAFDEYGIVPWEGESRAIEEYFAKLSLSPTIRRHPFTQQPGGWIVK